jgi:hypothetical protein
MGSLLKRLSSNLLDWHLTPEGVQVYAAPVDRACQWITMCRQCPTCDHIFVAVAPVGSAGIECPNCHEVDMWFLWKGEQ